MDCSQKHDVSVMCISNTMTFALLSDEQALFCRERHDVSVTCLPNLRRTRCSSLLWQLPMRDLLGLLRKNPDLYRSACRQAVPGVAF